MCGIQFNYNSKEVYNTMISPDIVSNIRHRGPDAYYEHAEEVKHDGIVAFGFHRLFVMNTHSGAKQPFIRGSWIVICNGEIYNYMSLYTRFNCTPTTSSDCEIIAALLDMYHTDGVQDSYDLAQQLRSLDGEFAFCAWNVKSQQLIMCRDLTGVRPLYYTIYNTHNNVVNDIFNQIFGTDQNITQTHTTSNIDDTIQSDVRNRCWMSVASEQKGLFTGNGLVTSTVRAVDPAFIYVVTIRSNWINHVYVSRWSPQYPLLDHAIQCKDPWTALHTSVRQSLMGSCDKGCFLSGGLDSSIVASLLTYYNADVDYFTIGLQDDSSDIQNSRIVAEWLGIKDRHHVYTFTLQEGYDVLEEIIGVLETYDVTTIRASIPQYLLCKYIRRDYPNIKVMFSGEGSDELFQGYYYSHFATQDTDLQEDRTHLLRYLHRFDNLRIDRVTAAFGFEARVPFLHQHTLVSATHQPLIAGKHVLRQYPWNLPESILHRPKHALSDAVSSSSTCWYKSLKSYVESKYNKSEREAYRYIYYQLGYSNVYTDEPLYWMPKWVETDDPSATVLSGFTE